MTLEEIQNEIEKGGLTPSQMAEYRSILSGKYSRARDEWDKLETAHFTFLNCEAVANDSEAAKERRWNGTEEGQLWRYWESQMRKCERMMSSLKTQIEVAMGEARNLI